MMSMDIWFEIDYCDIFVYISYLIIHFCINGLQVINRNKKKLVFLTLTY